jgi:hypothetical protein
MIRADDNVYGTFCAEPSAEEIYIEEVLIEPPYDQEYEYSDGYEH